MNRFHFLTQIFLGKASVNRYPFAVASFGLIIVKLLVDRLILLSLDIPWLEWLAHAAGLYLGFAKAVPEDAVWGPYILAGSLPFLWIGLGLTVGRLRSLHWPLWLSLLLFIPGVMLLLFIPLLLLPGSVDSSPPRLSTLRSRENWIPRSRFGSALTGCLVGSVFGTFAVWLVANQLHGYGWALFVATPFLVGFITTLIHCYHQPDSRYACFALSLLSLSLIALYLLAIALEGILCLIMASPIALVLAGIGSCVGHAICEAWFKRTSTVVLSACFLLPLLGTAEKLLNAPSQVHPVRTEILIAAPPAVVWQHVVTFSDLPPPTEWIFRLGIAYPLRARIKGQGPGAIRHCEFSTGPFIEPIDVWDEPRLLSFSVISNPAPMEEWTPYRHIHPPHLEGFLVSKRGQFELFPLPDGGTRLVGTTWYQHGLLPEAYWRIGSDFIIHTIHQRVLTHIRSLAETPPSSLSK